MSALLDFILDHVQFQKYNQLLHRWDLTHANKILDSGRLPSLYSDFRHLRTNNPNGFLANVTAWKTVLSLASRQGLFPNTKDTLILRTGEELVSSLVTKEWGRPLALETVLSEAVQTQEFIPLAAFLGLTESVYYKAWINPWGILGWGLETVGLKTRMVADERLSKGAFVIMKNVEDSANMILQEIAQRPNNVGRIFTLGQFSQEFANMHKPRFKFSEADLSVLLKFISRDLREASVSDTTIKFRNNNEDPSPVTENDTTIANLKALVSSFHSQIDLLVTKVSECNAKAHTALADNNKILALVALKSRKIAESTLQARAKVLGQIEPVLASIEQAADNVELVTQLQRSAKVLKMLNKQTGGVEDVEEVIDALNKQMDVVEGVTRVIGKAGAKVDDDEVEGELKELLKEEERKQEMVGLEERRREVAKALWPTSESDISKSLDELNLKAGRKREQRREVRNAVSLLAS